MPSSGVLVQGGVEKLERVLWTWTLVPMGRYKAAGLSFSDLEEAKDKANNSLQKTWLQQQRN